MHRLKWAGIVIPVFVVAAVLGLGTFWWQPVGATGEPAYRVYLPVVFGQPTAPPTPTPSVRLELVSTPYVYQSSFSSYVYVFGEVRNAGSTTRYFVQVTATFRDDNGTVKGSESAYLTTTMLKPGEKAPFRILTEPAKGWTRVEVTISPGSSSSYIEYTHDFAFSNVSAYTGVGGVYYVVGDITNLTGRRQSYVRVIGALYGSSGQTIDVDWAYVGGTHLDPGQTTSFRLSFTPRDTPVTYGLIAEGWYCRTCTESTSEGLSEAEALAREEQSVGRGRE